MAIKKAKEMIMGSAGHNGMKQTNLSTMKPIPSNTSHQDMDKLFKTLRQKYYRGTLAQDYAKERHLDYKKLELGFNPYSNTDFKGVKNCLVFPLKDIDDKVVSLYGRSVAKNPRSKHFYTKNRFGLYPGYPELTTKTLIIVEAPIDAATILSHTKYTPLSLYGTNGWTEEHTTGIKRIEDLEEVIFFLDGDPAGNQAIQTYAGVVKALASTCTVSRVRTPEREDVNSLLDSHEPQILTHLIEQRKIIHGSKPKTTEVQKPTNFSFSSENGSVKKKKDAPLREALNETVSKDESKPEHHGLNDQDPEFISWEHLQLSYRILGKVSLFPVDKLVQTLEVSKKGSDNPRHKIRQRINLYEDDKLEKLADKIAARMELSTRDVHGSLIQLADLLTEYRTDRIKLENEDPDEPAPMSTERRKEIFEFLKQPNLLARINELIGKTGLIGEEKNRMLLWLIYTSRICAEPLHVMCLGASGTGKTYLQEKVSALIPEKDKLEITAMSDNSVYYFDREELKHKLVLIEDLDGANEEKVMYALRELMSKKRISKKVVIKDNQGRMRTITLKVEGPICLSGTTTRESLYEDNANRSILIYLDQSSNQKQSIMDYQCRKSANLINTTEQESAKQFLLDVQRVIRNVRVVNPYAMDLKLPTEVFKPLRTNQHYLKIIEIVTLVHQFQRERKRDANNNYHIETAIEDIEIANALIEEVLLTKSDELTKACRDFFERVKRWMERTGKNSFYRNQIRDAFRMNPNNVKYYLRQLANFGLVRIAGGNRYKSGYEYEVVSMEEYEALRNRLNNALREAVKRIRSKNLVAVSG